MPISVVLLVVTAASIVGNTIVATPRTGPEPVDYTVFSVPGADILRGHWVGVFDSSTIQAGPFELIFWAIPYLIGVHGVTGWIAFGIVAGSLFSVALAALVQRLLRAIAPNWSVPLAIATATVAALTGLISTPTSAGHPSEIAVPLLWIIAAVLARRGRPAAAAAVLASTAGWELWGLLAVPVLLLAPRIDIRTVWRSALGGIVVLAALFLPFVLLGPFNMFSFSWTIRGNTLVHVFFPHLNTFPWPFRATQGVLSVGAGSAVAFLLRRRLDAIWVVPLVVCIVRLFTDPVLAGYYAVPPLLMLLIGSALGVAQRRPLRALLALVMLNVVVDTPLTLITSGILLVLTVVMTVLVIRENRVAAAEEPAVERMSRR
jgi:ABC-type multidrug transport system fused ATPase/permease subunit